MEALLLLADAFILRDVADDADHAGKRAVLIDGLALQEAPDIVPIELEVAEPDFRGAALSAREYPHGRFRIFGMGNFLIVKFLAEVGGYVFGNLVFVPPADRLIEDNRIRFAIILIDHVRGVLHNDAVTVAFPIELDLCRLLLCDVNEDALVDFCAVRVFHEPGDEVDPDGLLVIEAAAAVFDVYRRIRFGGFHERGYDCAAIRRGDGTERPFVCGSVRAEHLEEIVVGLKQGKLCPDKDFGDAAGNAVIGGVAFPLDALKLRDV